MRKAKSASTEFVIARLSFGVSTTVCCSFCQGWSDAERTEMC